MNPKRELQLLIASRNPLIAVVSRDEEQVEANITSVAESLDMGVQLWDCAAGMQAASGEVTAGGVLEPDDALSYIMDWGSDCVFILRDFHPFLDGGMPANVMTIRKLRDMRRILKGAPENAPNRCVILLSPQLKLPPELESEVAYMKWPMPDRKDLHRVVDGLVAAVPSLKVEDDTKAALVDAALGLGYIEAENALAKAIVSGDLSPAQVLTSKKMAVEKSGCVRWKEPPAGGLDWVGGLDELKAWLRLRKRAFSEEARAAGLPRPKGILCVGPPGTGKSLVAECCAATWGVPDIALGQIMGSLLGESENNFEKALEIAEATAPCILFLDEVEKMFGGVGGSGESDGGVKKGLFGRFLSWMQEKKADVFVVATANDVEQLPAELLRKGRFDELWYVGLPNLDEREAILLVHLQRNGRGLSDAARTAAAKQMDGFSGAEIEAVVVDAMYRAFDTGEEFSLSHVIAAIDKTVPLSRTAKEKLDALLNWAKGRARFATSQETKKVASGSRFAGLGNLPDTN